MQLQNPKIDVVTISYNSEDTIKRTLDSALINRDSINKFIIIDGGSKDSTLNIIKGYSDSIDCLISEPDRGISDAFNKGISRSDGDFVLLLNSDDWIEGQSLLELRRNLSVDDEVVCTLMRSIRQGIPVSVHRSSPNNLPMYSSILHPGTLINRKIYIEYGNYSEEYKVAMDYEYFSRLYSKKVKFRCIDIQLVNFNEGGLSGNSPLQIFMEASRIRRIYFNTLIPFRQFFQVLIRLIGMLAIKLKIEPQARHFKKFFLK